jgi:hypothetical protein
MNNSRRSKIYFSFAILAIVFGFYVISISLDLGARGYFSFQIAMAGAGLTLMIVAIGNFLVAYAISYGRVDRVVGNGEEVTLSKGGMILKSRRRLQMFSDLDKDSGNLAKEHHTVIFFCDWMPWSCLLGQFEVNETKKL